MSGVLVTGVGKSGNNLLLKLCNLLGFGTYPGGLGAHMFLGRHALLKRAVAANLFRNPIALGLANPWSAHEGALKLRLSKARERVIGGHLAYSSQLLAIVQAEHFVPLCIKRDPRDILVSYAHWILTRPDMAAHSAHAALDFDERIALVLDGATSGPVRFDSFPTILDRAWGWTVDPAVTTVSFEDLVGAANGGSDTAQGRAIEMVAEAVGAVSPRIDEISEQLIGGTQTFRKGRAESWRQELSRPLLEMAERVITPQRLVAWGYEPAIQSHASS